MRRRSQFALLRAFCLPLALVATPAVAADPADPGAVPEGEETGEFSAHGFDALRIENEFKLTLPREQTEDAWTYLQKRYAPDSPWLAELTDGITTKLSNEQFRDRYFDDPSLGLLHAQSAVRHRTRWNLGDPTDRKSGRELIQIKLQRPGDQELNRSEIKFPVKHYAPTKPLDSHPVIGLIDRDHRSDFMRTVAEHGYDAMRLEPKLTLDQHRRRVYISRAGSPFATITLDEVSSEKWGETVAFTEIEMELNEIAYTEVSESVRAEMEAVNERMKRDLMTAFPSIVQDQTPKYNKVFNALDRRIRFLSLALRMGAPVERMAALTAVPVLLLAVMAFRTRKRR